MKKFFIVALLLCSMTVFAEERIKYVEATDLTLLGKLVPTSNPYHRVDTVQFKGFTEKENLQVRMSSGISVVFKTNSKKIYVRAKYGYLDYPTNTMPISARGFDMYIKQDGQWLWASANVAKRGQENKQELRMIDNMDGQMKECLIYLPLLSEVYSLEIGVEEGSALEALDNPFRHRIGVFGSSFTHGISTSRPGMTWPAQLSRHTGLQMLSIACSGNSKLQPYFADVLAAADVDAYLFDAFSNPTSQMIKDRLFPFIEKLQTSHPDVPIIFVRTIYRERSNFDLKTRKSQAERLAVTDSLMAIAVKKYPNVYYVHSNATSELHETSVDGTHPNDYGYTLWADSIEKKVVKILKKYGIK